MERHTLPLIQNRCKELREARGLRVVDLASMTGVSDTTIYNIETRGGGQITSIAAVADALEVSIDELLIRETV